MAEVIWAPRALDQLDAIRQLIARDAPRHADLFLLRVLKSVDRLRLFPRSGRVVPERRRDDLREVFVHRYRIIYHLTGDRVEIVAIRHGSQLLGNLDAD